MYIDRGIKASAHCAAGVYEMIIHRCEPDSKCAPAPMRTVASNASRLLRLANVWCMATSASYKRFGTPHLCYWAVCPAYGFSLPVNATTNRPGCSRIFERYSRSPVSQGGMACPWTFIGSANRAKEIHKAYLSSWSSYDL